MVRILNQKNVDKISNLIYFTFKIQEFFTHIVEVEHPNTEPCIYAMWHAHQCCIHGLQNRGKTNVLISRSKDGEVIARVVGKWGFKLIRGSKGRQGAVEASMQMIEALKNGENCAMMVDGPRGPAKVVKDGVIKIARLSGKPIVPIYWYSTNFNWLRLPSWDGLRMPFFDVRLINLYGKPIYVSKDETDEEARLRLQASLEELEKRAPEVYKKVYRFGLWRIRK
jgi:hypothetical protein